jgi:hypothetical protein
MAWPLHGPGQWIDFNLKGQPGVPAVRKGRILADRILAVPMAFLFNGIARLLGSLLRRDHSVSPENVKVQS